MSASETRSPVSFPPRLRHAVTHRARQGSICSNVLEWQVGSERNHAAPAVTGAADVHLCYSSVRVPDAADLSGIRIESCTSRSICWSAGLMSSSAAGLSRSRRSASAVAGRRCWPRSRAWTAARSAAGGVNSKPVWPSVRPSVSAPLVVGAPSARRRIQSCFRLSKRCLPSDGRRSDGPTRKEQAQLAASPEHRPERRRTPREPPDGGALAAPTRLLAQGQCPAYGGAQFAARTRGPVPPYR